MYRKKTLQCKKALGIVSRLIQNIHRDFNILHKETCSFQNDLRQACFICSNLSVSMADIKVFLLTHRKAWWSPTCYLHCQNSTGFIKASNSATFHSFSDQILYRKKPITCTTILLILISNQWRKVRVIFWTK